MTRKVLYCLVLGVVFTLLPSWTYSQSMETGAIEGTVQDDQGNFVFGATVTISSPHLIGGDQTATTNKNGKYRFVVLPPGTYSVDAATPGFTPQRLVDLRLSVSTTLTADFTLKLGEIKDEITVLAEAPLIDVVSSSTSNIVLQEDFLRNIPTGQDSRTIVNLAPGVTNSGSAYGAEENSGVQPQADGVNTTEATSGSNMAVRLDYNIVQETNIHGVGAAAEYGGVDGVIANMITKSGGNSFKGHVEYIHQDEGWNSTNTSVEELTPPGKSYADANFYLGGPIVRDKVWFFGAYRHVGEETQVTGFDHPMDQKMDNIFLKITAQPSARTRIQGFYEYETNDVDNYGANALTSPEAAMVFDLHNNVWNFSLFHIFSDSTFLEAKFAGYDGAQLIDGKAGRDVPSRDDLATGMSYDNSFMYVDMPVQRLQLDTALSHYTDQFLSGSHDFKVGAQYEKGSTQVVQGVNGGMSYTEMAGEPYLLVEWGGVESDIESTTLSFFAQESWRVNDRLTINPGLRYNIYRGEGNNTGQTIYEAEGLAPRLGFSYNLFGDNKTILKGHYGWYYSGMKGNYYKSIDDVIHDYVMSIWMGPDVGYYEFLRFTSENTYSMDPNIDHPRTEEFTIGVQRELSKDLSLSATYIHREGKDSIQTVNTTGEYVEMPYTDPETGEVSTIWAQTNPGEDQYQYTNPDAGGPYDVVMLDPKMEYDSFSLTLNKRYSNRWMLLASYVYTDITSTFGNSFGDTQPRPGAGLYSSPNAQINAEGRPNNDPTHMVKIQGTANLPLDFSLGMNFTYVSGTTYQRNSFPEMLPQGLVSFMTEQQGARRLDDHISLDLRLEKQFSFGDNKLGIFVDAYNLLDRSVPTAVYTTAGENFENPTALSTPRGVKAGLRFFFN
ncbi:MAG: TonB-dependent receptor [Acidobacteriota bacterium]